MCCSRWRARIRVPYWQVARAQMELLAPPHLIPFGRGSTSKLWPTMYREQLIRTCASLAHARSNVPIVRDGWR